MWKFYCTFTIYRPEPNDNFLQNTKILNGCLSRANTATLYDCPVYFENPVFALTVTLVSKINYMEASMLPKTSWNRFPIEFWHGNDPYTQCIGLQELITYSSWQNHPNPEKIQYFVKKNSNTAKNDFFTKMKTCCPHQLSWSGQHVFIFLKSSILAEFEFFLTDTEVL